MRPPDCFQLAMCYQKNGIPMIQISRRRTSKRIAATRGSQLQDGKAYFGLAVNISTTSLRTRSKSKASSCRPLTMALADYAISNHIGNDSQRVGAMPANQVIGCNVCRSQRNHRGFRQTKLVNCPSKFIHIMNLLVIIAIILAK